MADHRTFLSASCELPVWMVALAVFNSALLIVLGIHVVLGG